MNPQLVLLLMLLACFLESLEAKTYTRQDFLKTTNSLYNLGEIYITPFPLSLVLAKKLHILVLRELLGSASIALIPKPMYWLFTEG